MPRSDEEIRRQIEDQLEWDDRVDATGVGVAVEDRRVRLEGAVPTHRARSAVFEDAWAVLGVKEVTDELRVEPEGGFDVPSDVTLRSHVESALSFSPDLDAERIDVTVDGGEVDLEGSVSSFWRKGLAEELVASIRGVRRIDDRLAVVPAVDRLDDDVARDLMAALHRDVRVPERELEVSVEEGVVTLAGRVPTRAARRAAHAVARHTAGVVAVRDRMTVGSVAAPVS